MKLFYLALFLLVMQACSSAPVPPTPPIHIDVGYFDKESTALPVDNLPKQVFLNFRLIPGALVGELSSKGQQSTFVDTEGPLTIYPDHLQRLIESYAAPLVDTPMHAAITTEPPDARLLRVGVFAYDPDTSSPFGLTIFDAPEKAVQELFLVYFDRPTKLTGSYEKDGVLIEYHVRSEEEGFTWLKFVRLEPDLMMVTNHTFAGDEFLSIQLAD